MLEKMNRITALNEELERMLYPNFNEVVTMPTKKPIYVCERCELHPAVAEYTARDEDGDSYNTNLCQLCLDVELPALLEGGYRFRRNPNRGRL